MTLYSHKVTPQCLSHMRLGRLASGDLQTSTMDIEHLAHCDACRVILHKQQEDVRAMVVENVPSKLLAASESSKRRQSSMRMPWTAWVAVAAAACAVVLLIPHTTNKATMTHLKGIPSLEISLTRGNTLILDEVPIEKINTVRVGDRLRVRVVNAQNQLVQLELCELEGACNTLFYGELPQDAWIPTGLKIDTPTPTVFRLRVCPVGSSIQQCKPHDYTLRSL